VGEYLYGFRHPAYLIILKVMHPLSGAQIYDICYNFAWVFRARGV